MGNKSSITEENTDEKIDELTNDYGTIEFIENEKPKISERSMVRLFNYALLFKEEEILMEMLDSYDYEIKILLGRLTFTHDLILNDGLVKVDPNVLRKVIQHPNLDLRCKEIIFKKIKFYHIYSISLLCELLDDENFKILEESNKNFSYNNDEYILSIINNAFCKQSEEIYILLEDSLISKKIKSLLPRFLNEVWLNILNYKYLINLIKKKVIDVNIGDGILFEIAFSFDYGMNTDFLIYLCKNYDKSKISIPIQEKLVSNIYSKLCNPEYNFRLHIIFRIYDITMYGSENMVVSFFKEFSFLIFSAEESKWKYDKWKQYIFDLWINEYIDENILNNCWEAFWEGYMNNNQSSKLVKKNITRRSINLEKISYLREIINFFLSNNTFDPTKQGMIWMTELINI